jgi:hypothetical protein
MFCQTLGRRTCGKSVAVDFAGVGELELTSTSMLVYRCAEVDTMRERLRVLREQLFHLLTSVLQVRALAPS